MFYLRVTTCSIGTMSQRTRFVPQTEADDAEEALGFIRSWQFTSAQARGWCYYFESGQLPIPYEHLASYDENTLTREVMLYANVLAGAVPPALRDSDAYAWMDGNLFLVDVKAGTPDSDGFMLAIHDAFDFLARDMDIVALALLVFSDLNTEPYTQRLRADGWVNDPQFDMYTKISAWREMTQLVLPPHVN